MHARCKREPRRRKLTSWGTCGLRRGGSCSRSQDLSARRNGSGKNPAAATRGTKDEDPSNTDPDAPAHLAARTLLMARFLFQVPEAYKHESRHSHPTFAQKANPMRNEKNTDCTLYSYFLHLVFVHPSMICSHHATQESRTCRFESR